MSLRDTLNRNKEKKDQETASAAEQKAGKKLGKIARNLKKEMEKRAQEGEGWDIVERLYDMPLATEELKNLDAYRQLHENCKTNDMKVELVAERHEHSYCVPPGMDEYYYVPIVTISPKEPYSASPDAHLFDSSITAPAAAKQEKKTTADRNEILQLPPEELKGLLAQIRQARAEEFNAVSSPEALAEDMEAPKRIVVSRRQKTGLVR